MSEFNIKYYLKEDLFQDCMVLLFTAIYKYDSTKYKSFYAYFNRIVSNRIYDIKGRMFKDPIIKEMPISMICEKDKRTSDLDLDYSKNIYYGLNKLEITVIELKFVKNWSVEEIASFLSKSRSSIYKIICSAKEKIMKNTITDE